MADNNSDDEDIHQPILVSTSVSDASQRCQPSTSSDFSCSKTQ